MVSRKAKKKYNRYSRRHEIPKPKSVVTCDKCGQPVHCDRDDMLSAFFNHNCP